ncbi:hypothetical protein DXG01_006952 [Tephrocybe rancida]|nr:hypothetical protein DXG01_006952 [Tephrocybe rancida]
MMLVFKFALSLFLATSAFAESRNARCGTVPSDEKVAAMERHFNANKIESSRGAAQMFNFKSYRIGKLTECCSQVFWHVVSENRTAAGGDVPASQITSQIDVINKAYAETGIQWTLSGTTRTVNAEWFNNATSGNAQQTAMKKSLRQGTAADLNVYSVGFTSGEAGDLLGYATFPLEYSHNPQDDGIVLSFTTLPGGSKVPYNLGQTLSHEAGHWIGLYHTFQGGCNSPGDTVSDTPAEALPVSVSGPGCHDSRDSCPGDEGLDPVRNYMDYGEDTCVTNFTPGQVARAVSQLNTYHVSA